MTSTLTNPETLVTDYMQTQLVTHYADYGEPETLALLENGAGCLIREINNGETFTLEYISEQKFLPSRDKCTELDGRRTVNQFISEL